MIIRPAVPADGPQMLRLIESHPAEGGLRILYTRRPDAYQSYRTECANAEITVCADNDGHVLGQVALLPRKLFLNREIYTIGYVTGLHKSDSVVVNIMNMLETGLANSVAEQFFCSFLNNNKSVFDLFSKRRLICPLCDYSTYLFHPTAMKPAQHGFLFRPASPDDTAELLRFYNKEGAKYSCFPVFSTMDDFPGLTVSDFFLLEDGNGIAAAGALWDQRAFKQYVVLGYRGQYKLAAHCNPLLRMLHYPPLPKVNAAANFAYISFLLGREGSSPLAHILLKEIAGVRHGFDFLAIGAAAGSTLGQYLKGINSFKIESKICAIDHEGSGKAALIQPPFHFECGLL